jgi:ABC-type nitrate/sulfonate/bicarbonate transport system ATPase subunit
MLQRLALARSLAVRPAAIILDEPFSSVDPLARQQLRVLVSRLQRTEKFALVLVTHDIEDVFSMAQRFLVLAGRPARPTADEPVGQNYAVFHDRVIAAMAAENGAASRRSHHGNSAGTLIE